jgi:class 3 adenylate cyclase
MDNPDKIIEQLTASLEENEKQLKLLLENQNNEIDRIVNERTQKYETELKEIEDKYKRSEELLWKVTIRSDKMVEKQFKRSEELLLNILPYEVAEELKQKGSAEAKAFESVTVLFTDFKDFTTMAETLSAKELVAEIDHCFRAFDAIVGKYKVEKIKTIGDSYMAVGGLPVTNTTHATDVVNAAIEIRDFMVAYKEQKLKEGKAVFEVRIGIHTGNVVAGIVGSKKFAYDIWGDTVNTASRLESSGAAGKVNISETTYQLVKDQFICTCRGKIEAKKKGLMDMYFAEK